MAVWYKTSTLTTVSVTIRKELLILRRYLPNLLSTLLQIGLRIGFFLFLSGIISYTGSYSLAGKDLFIFIVCSLWTEWTVFILMALFYVLVSRFLLTHIGKRIKRCGLHLL